MATRVAQSRQSYGGSQLALENNTGFVPAGGTTGQVLTKTASATAWATPGNLTMVTVTAAYTILAADRVIIANSASGLVVTLPSAVTAGAGKPYTVKNINTGTVTMAATAGTVDGGAASTVTVVQWGVRTFVSDGTNWFLM